MNIRHDDISGQHKAPILVWMRQDLRITDHPALLAAMDEGRVLPVFILDDDGAGPWKIGGAQRWWLHHSLMALDLSLRKRGNRLILRRGATVDQLGRLARETGATRIHAIRHYEPWQKAAQEQVAQMLDLELHDGNYLAAPDSIRNGQGERYRVFTPWYRRLLEQMPPRIPFRPPERIPGPESFPESDAIQDWQLLPLKPDWSKGFQDWLPGEKGAWRALQTFLPKARDYKEDRDFPGIAATSRLSPHLHFGEISPRAIWHALEENDGPGTASFRSEIGWREHGINLVDQIPAYADRNGRSQFDQFAWRSGDEADRDFMAWTRGLTGYPVVDAGMRELWQTGWMHNRVRMITASFLVKHLLIDWRRGERWFWDTLLDADLGANAMNWQYVAGSGVDAPVFSRIMSPRLQSEKFNMAGYVRTYVPELAHLSDIEIHEAHIAGVKASDYPDLIIGHDAARARALSAWERARA
jgi:deoxyribodipyrimidine photo-lyase